MKESKPKLVSKFWSAKKIGMIFLLVLGIVIGYLLAVYFVYPVFNAEQSTQLDDLKSKNSLLEGQVDQYLVCLNAHKINRDTCAAELEVG